MRGCNCSSFARAPAKLALWRVRHSHKPVEVDRVSSTHSFGRLSLVLPGVGIAKGKDSVGHVFYGAMPSNATFDG